MDGRTEEQKLYDAALRSEKRTIGHRMSRKVLVIAPTNRHAQEWAHEHGIAFSDTIVCTEVNWQHQMQGLRGVEHVILGWAYFTKQARLLIKNGLIAIESPPFEGDPVDPGLHTANPERV